MLKPPCATIGTNPSYFNARTKVREGARRRKKEREGEEYALLKVRLRLY